MENFSGVREDGTFWEKIKKWFGCAVLEELPDGMVKETAPAYLGADAAVKIDTIIQNLEERGNARRRKQKII